MKQVILNPLYHRGQQNNSLLKVTVRKLPKAKWSQTHRCWYVPLNKESFQHILKILKGITSVNYQELKEYLQKRKTISSIKTKSGQTAGIASQAPSISNITNDTCNR